MKYVQDSKSGLLIPRREAIGKLVCAFPALCLTRKSVAQWAGSFGDQGFLAAGQVASGGGTTYTLRDNQYGGGGNDSPPAITNAYVWYATKFTAGGTSYDVTKITLSLEKVGTPSFTIKLAIYNDVAGVPVLQQGNGTKNSNSTNVSTFTTGYLDYDFLFSAGNEGHVNSGAAQWVAIICSSSPNDAANYIQWQGQALSATANKKSADGTTWTDANTFAQASFKLYSSP